MYKIGVIGTQGGWSAERLADAVQAQTGFRMLIDMREVGLDLDQGQVTFQEQENPIMYIQQKIDLPGCDLGLAFLGGEYLGTYARCNSTDFWNTTTANGGKYTPYQPAHESIELATQAQDLFKLDFTTVDLAESKRHRAVLLSGPRQETKALP